ncbi:Hydroxymethylglutaryl-CoA synthase [Giardia duodenalis]|uniref:Hydroxymethylglutaryl-CoA synthase n=1 Tax=Giardia intestinalis (strain ATCC 50803 / WB clone C6) TaxID=184922 RepID=A8BYF2_GIAIC|nr:Hydroxymethylglutaryl-CoA synthase [Giardia intestinalis]KAE8302705.1 Hydroxymethylglutaryl-CoA synthase [Giardia intestinalis]|eukprot:XP_001704164.1 Hydroxymethylglutaryl-CoA synthase [Giardia lamblia ATCC 50803]
MSRDTHVEHAPLQPPAEVRIAAIAVYIPPIVVSQEEVSSLCKIPLEKITKGLGQHQMAVTVDSEDSVSLALNSLQLLIDDKATQDILSKVTIGRLEVGTESSVDKAKSIKSVLADMLGAVRTTGADIINACLGGVLALENAALWLSAAKYDDETNKYPAAIVVTTDISIYNDIASIPTGGAGAVALLLVKDYPSGIVCDASFNSYWENTTDFYKPHIASPVPVVHGATSIECYLRANLLAAMSNEQQRRLFLDADFACFHTPYCTLPKKMHALLYHALHLESDKEDELFAAIQSRDSNVLSVLSKNCLADPSISEDCERRCVPSLKLSSQTGNIYTGSIFLALVSILEHIEAIAASQVATASPTHYRTPLKDEYLIYASGYGSGMGSLAFKFSVYPNQMPCVLKIKRVAAPPSEGMLRLSLQSNKRLLMHRLSQDPLVQEFLQDRFRQQVKPETDEYITGDREHFSCGEWYLDRVGCDGVRHYKRWLDK